jgi:hypothetical protein
MIRLRSVGVLSCAKVFAVIHAALGVLFGMLFLLIGVIGIAAAPSHQKLGMLAIILISLFMPVFYGLLGSVIGALWGLLYNVVAQKIGGLELEFESLTPLSYIAPFDAVGA